MTFDLDLDYNFPMTWYSSWETQYRNMNSSSYKNKYACPSALGVMGGGTKLYRSNDLSKTVYGADITDGIYPMKYWIDDDYGNRYIRMYDLLYDFSNNINIHCKLSSRIGDTETGVYICLLPQVSNYPITSGDQYIFMNRYKIPGTASGNDIYEIWDILPMNREQDSFKELRIPIVDNKYAAPNDFTMKVVGTLSNGQSFTVQQRKAEISESYNVRGNISFRFNFYPYELTPGSSLEITTNYM